MTKRNNDALAVNRRLLERSNDLGIMTEKPKFPQYATPSKRKESYENGWPSHSPVEPDQLADAGLVFTGVADVVRCYHCGGGLRNWEPGDDPWEEHAKWFPKCPHVILSKGRDYIDRVRKGEKPLKPKTSDAVLLETVPALSCKENGYSDEAVLEAIKTYRGKNADGDGFTAADILSIILEREEAANNQTDDEEEFLDAEKLYEENRLLKEKQICVICLDDIAHIVLLPCGHMVSCPKCAPALTKCPLCRAVVNGSLKALF